MVTASIDAIQFGVPISQGQMVELRGDVVYTGHTSCVVKTVVYSQNLISGERRYCCQGYFTMVAIDAGGRPAAVPRIPVETEEARQEWETAQEIKNTLLERRRRMSEPGTV
jgi:acyl-CoA hydrolase